MEQTFNKVEKLKQLLIILFPIFITQLGMVSMNFFDTMMSGHAGSHDLAGVAIGSSLWLPVFTGLSGILQSITPIVSQLVGARNEKNVSFTVIQGVYLSIVIATIVIIIGTISLNPILNMMSLESEVQRIAHDYLVGLAIGMIPLFIYTVLRSFIDALGKTRVSMVITLLSLPINVVLNYVLIFGKFGFPKLGGVGAGYASGITYWIIMLLAIYIVMKQRPFNSYKIFAKFHFVSFSKWREILTIGIPIGFAIFFETSIFSAVTLFMSTFSTITIAAHQAAMNFETLLYMAPLSISMAITILIGFEVGAQRYEDARQYSLLAITLGVLMAVVGGLILFFFRYEIAGWYTNDPDVLNLAAKFLIFALFFQLSDAVAAPIQGALRGYKDVNFTFIMALVSYWLIGLPFGYVLATYTQLQAFGYWVGLIVGLATGAIALLGRLIYVQKQFTKDEGRNTAKT